MTVGLMGFPENNTATRLEPGCAGFPQPNVYRFGPGMAHVPRSLLLEGPVWQTVVTPSIDISNWEVGMHGVIICVANSSDAIWRSADLGRTWRLINTGVGDYKIISTDNRGRWCILTGNNSPSAVSLISLDNGYTWRTSFSNLNSSQFWYGGSFSGGNFHTIGYGTAANNISTDGGNNWIAGSTSGLGANNWRSIIASSTGARIVTSDSQTGVYRQDSPSAPWSQVATFSGFNYRGVYAKGRFLYPNHTTGGNVWVSEDDGRSFKQWATPNATTVYEAKYWNGVYFLFSVATNDVYTSLDGKNWNIALNRMPIGATGNIIGSSYGVFFRAVNGSTVGYLGLAA